MQFHCQMAPKSLEKRAAYAYMQDLLKDRGAAPRLADEAKKAEPGTPKKKGEGLAALTADRTKWLANNVLHNQWKRLARDRQDEYASSVQGGSTNTGGSTVSVEKSTQEPSTSSAGSVKGGNGGVCRAICVILMLCFSNAHTEQAEHLPGRVKPVSHPIS